MFDPRVQEELKRASRKALIMHIALLGEPLIYIIIASALREIADLKGADGSGVSVSLLPSIFMLISVALIPAIIFLQKILFAPENLAPGGADVETAAMLVFRAQAIVDALAVVPATLGFVLFLLGGNFGYLILLAAMSIAMLIMVFPRSETLEKAVMAGMMKSERMGAVPEESE